MVQREGACALLGVSIKPETFLPAVWRAVERGYVSVDNATFVRRVAVPVPLHVLSSGVAHLGHPLVWVPLPPVGGLSVHMCRFGPQAGGRQLRAGSFTGRK